MELTGRGEILEQEECEKKKGEGGGTTKMECLDGRDGGEAFKDKHLKSKQPSKKDAPIQRTQCKILHLDLLMGWRKKETGGRKESYPEAPANVYATRWIVSPSKCK